MPIQMFYAKCRHKLELLLQSILAQWGLDQYPRGKQAQRKLWELHYLLKVLCRLLTVKVMSGRFTWLKFHPANSITSLICHLETKLPCKMRLKESLGWLGNAK